MLICYNFHPVVYMSAVASYPFTFIRDIVVIIPTNNPPNNKIVKYLRSCRCINIYGWNYSECPAHLKNDQFLALFWSLFQVKVLQNTPSLLVKCDSQLTADEIPYNNRNDGVRAAGLLSLVEVSEKAIGTMVNAFDYVTATI